MTTAQRRRFYFPAWAACAAANDWKMERGRLVADLDVQVIEFRGWPEPAGPEAVRVLDVATQQALIEHRAPDAEDLRHGCNYVAARQFSSQKLKNAETTRVVNLFRLLTDPWDLDAVMEWLDPNEANRRSYISFLSKVTHEGVLRAISENAFQTKDWESLQMEKLRWICGQVKGRGKASRERRPTKATVDPELIPF